VERLVLWDIDRTLVSIGPVGTEIFSSAFAAAAGCALTRVPDMSGRTDHDLITTALAEHGVPVTDAAVARFYAAFIAGMHHRRAEVAAGGTALPGAARALAALSVVPGVVQSVVTGNLRENAYVKLSLFGLADHVDFEVGGYGSDDGRRATLVRLAMQRAERAYGRPYRGGQVTIIGDTPHDVVGAVENGARAIGVATGHSTAEQLAAAGAAVVLASLGDTDALVRAVLGGPAGSVA
jgi:phosphoglycolate phosphatase-like HAD superfamily hydrolase